MRKIFLLMAFGFFGTSLWAQSDIKFDNTKHDLGTIEEGKVATHDFVFTNTGNEPLILQGVEPSCGCTTPSYTREPVMPGKQGKITVSYNSKGRPNAFTKTVTVRTNGKTPMVMLFISGFVNPVTTASEKGGANSILTLEKSSFNIGTLQPGQTALQKVTIKNTGTDDLQLTGLRSDCNCVKHTFSKALLKPNEQTVVELRYTPKTGGNLTETVYVYSNSSINPTAKIQLSAKVAQQSPLSSGQKNPFGQ